MPIYEYDCSRCGRFDVQQPMWEASLPTYCLVCGELAARRYGTFNIGHPAESPGTDDSLTNTSTPGITIRNMTIDSCGAGVVNEGGTMDIDGLTITNTPEPIRNTGHMRLKNARIKRHDDAP